MSPITLASSAGHARSSAAFLTLARTLAIGCLSSVTLAVGPGTAAPASLASLAVIEQRLREDCAAERFSGVVVAQVSGRVVFKHVCGYADWSARTPMPENARFKIFSTTKSFTATAVLAMVDRGRLELDAPVTRYLTQAPRVWERVTLRHLLTHTSGIPDHTMLLLDAYLKHGRTTHSDAMDYVVSDLDPHEAALKTAPGATWAYNNFGYELLAQVVAEAAGRPFHEVLTEYVLRPSGMATASVELPVVSSDGLRGTAEAALVQGHNGAPGAPKVAVSNSFIQQGAGSLHAGWRDLIAFSTSLPQGAVVSRAAQARIITDSVPTGGTARYGLGWMIRTAGGRPYLYHSGGTNGFITDFLRSPDGRITVVQMSNLGFTRSHVGRDLMEALLTDEPSAALSGAQPQRSGAR